MRDCELRHGYTLRDLEDMTRAAARHDLSLAMDVWTKRDIASSAIALVLYEAEHPPRRGDLIRAGWSAIYREVAEVRRGRGFTQALVSVADHPDSRMAPGWMRYWWHGHADPVDERVVERIAVWQVLPTLTTASRDAVVALAATGDYQDAADVLDLSESTLLRRLVRARRAYLAAWYGSETPHRPRRVDKRARPDLADVCGNGHQWAPETTGTTRKIKRGRLYEARYCKLCRREAAARARQRRAA